MTNATNTAFEKTSFTLNPVGCGDCFWKIESGLKDLPGVQAVEYDMGKIFFEVTFDPQKTNRVRIVKCVEDMSFRLKDKHYETVGVFEAIRRAFAHNKAQKKVG